MEVREAVEADAGRLATLADAPADTMRNLVHDRTVRVADEGSEIVGFVSFDARRDTVHVTQLDGTTEVAARLLDEPARFARVEGMAAELLVEESRDELQRAAAAAGFERAGSGPRFEGAPTVRFRLEP
ncbi:MULTISPECIES: hypothetical protein [Halococcus]|uniref:N-acetyltransferase domain-containing protein n=1 Tax=Halococcus salifodinae DSM 8989 TaxID=1227456 RepID=M0NEK1_9EURY|nr:MULTISPECIES: hypothetical protein [Halococcus]EMA55110.1 hypothetical protein C450_03547 [Halococcus salifodinae DSM 8989]